MSSAAFNLPLDLSPAPTETAAVTVPDLTEELAQLTRALQLDEVTAQQAPIPERQLGNPVVNGAMTDASEATLSPHLKLPAGWYAEDVPAAAGTLPFKPASIGFILGILLLLPASIGWQKMSPASPELSIGDMKNLALEVVAEATAHAGRLAPGRAFEQARVERIAARALTAPSFEPQIEEARRLIAAKNIQAARDVLATATAAKSSRALFAMAETFDPNLLAAWGAQGVAADPERARSLYAAARTLGHDGADGRIEALR